MVENGGVRLAGGPHVACPLPAGCEPWTAVHLSVRPEKIWLDTLEDGMVELDGKVVEPCMWAPPRR